MASSYDISLGSDNLELNSVDGTYIALQVVSTSALDADITVKLVQSSDGDNFEDLANTTETIVAGENSVYIESYDFTLDSVYLNIDVGTATVGEINIYVSNKKKVEVSGGGAGSDVNVTNDPLNVAVTNTPIDTVVTNDIEVTTSDLLKDAFGLLQVAEPTTLFDAQFTYDLQPLLYEQVTTGSGTISHDTTNRCADISINAASGSNSAYLQTYEYFRYQPGKGQKVFITFNFNGTPASGYTKFAQYGDSNNAFRIQLDSNGDAKVRIITGTSQGNQEFTIDSAGLGIDWNKEQIFVLQFEALYVGSVEFYIQLNRTPTLVHVFDNANNTDYPYIQTANLPIRVGIEGTGAINESMLFNCCSIQSSGGQDDTLGYSFSAEGTATAANGSRTHVVTIRPLTTFNSFENRVKFVLESIDFLVTGNNPVRFELAIGQGLSSITWNDVNTTYSAFEVGTGGNAVGTASIYFDGAYLDSSNQVKGSVNTKVPIRVPITLDASGNTYLNGRLSVVATGIGGTSACRAKLNFKEIR